ncbi:biliverdin-producing heme oxygenase [Paenibacillus sp. PCH8]|uniref:biliverdin-producing heme oxygenase n=1 Tax=Paenibacillus sp. PCH8 TaxID=2066524 RepID=UPI000CF956AC|nr:biliverdin-producing heme oxygenase [Paenibacillus sp. PCH8]PQP81210.1 biliverdin-producing heme oxygenase [Paenibacillus sp. PCH8]
MTATNIMERLKSETAHYHRQVEQNPYAKAIMNQTVTLEEYRTYLEKFYGFLKPLEDQAVQQPFWESTGLDIEIRGKAGLLEKDLHNLGATQEEIDQLPRCEELPDISTPARLFGYLYVIEGSTNGGQIMTKRLSQFLPIEADRGLEYFNAYGSETRTRWSEFMVLLQQSITSSEDHDPMVHSASETFRLLDQWINTEK